MEPFVEISEDNKQVKDKTASKLVAIKIGLASSEKIRSWSKGEVKKPETINYRTLRPERGGLFCEKIFGPTKDYECYCGKYKRPRYKGTICDRCGVEVTSSKVRRLRMGHIDLAAPVAHIWYFKGTTSYIGSVLDLSNKEVEEIVYFSRYLILDPKDSGLQKFKTLSEDEYEYWVKQLGRSAIEVEHLNDGNYQVIDPKGTFLEAGRILTPDEYEYYTYSFGQDYFVAKMGAEAIKEALESINVEELSKQIREDMNSTSAQSPKRLKMIKRFRVLEFFRKSGANPAWMVLDAIPVIPPDLRPMVQLDGGRFATSDLNDLYRRVINRNNRLKKLCDMGAPEIIIRNEKRMLQEAVDALFDNERRLKPVTGTHDRPLRSLSDIIEGKQGRFRQNLLGKRVDYSGRSVIVVGPTLKLHQCGLPKEMALELFKPFVIHELIKRGLTGNVKGAKRKIERGENVIWDILAEVIQGHPVFLNRAPTLHRLGIQAFEPVLIEGKAIQLHPLVCTAFNADFDGDQMAVHVPLSLEAQAEARVLMLSSHNLLSPANGQPLVTPSQDMVLGLHYLTSFEKNPTFRTEEDALDAYKRGEIDETRKIDVYCERVNGYLTTCIKKIRSGQPFLFFIDKNDAITRYQMDSVSSSFDFKLSIIDRIALKINNEFLSTSVGQILFNEILPSEWPYYREPLTKKRIGKIVRQCYEDFGLTRTVKLVDDLKDMGFKYAKESGISISIDDLVVPPEKKEIIKKAEDEIRKFDEFVSEGTMTQEEKDAKVREKWNMVTDEVKDRMNTSMGERNPVFMMANSGARGNIDQVRQLAAMRGLMSDPHGRIIPIPIKANLKEGMNMMEYFISTYGARKGLVDTALRTSNSGYLTRRLVDVAQEIIVREEDCGSEESLIVTDIYDGTKVVLELKERIIGRFSAEDIYDVDGKIIVKRNELITPPVADKIVDAGIKEVAVRSPLTCKTPHGVCQKCYGWSMATREVVELGEAVGIIAAQSIGEPGTQLTMRTFHTGGVALHRSKHIERSKISGLVKFDSIKTFTFLNDNIENTIAISEGNIIIKGETTDKVFVNRGMLLHVKDGSLVKENDLLIEEDEDNEYLIGEKGNTVYYTMPIEERIISENNVITIASQNGEVLFTREKPVIIKVNANLDLKVKDREKVVPGKEIAEGITSPVLGMVIIPKIEPVLDSETGEMVTHVYIYQGDFASCNKNSRLFVKDSTKLSATTLVAISPKSKESAVKTKDIIQGLPRVEELFEARKPKNAAILSEIDGIVHIIANSDTDPIKIIIEGLDETKEIVVPASTQLQVSDGAFVKKGDPLTEGQFYPQDILRTKGIDAVKQYIVNEIQKVYRDQSVSIHDKHIEIIVRQMTKRVKIKNDGDSDWLPGEYVDRGEFEEVVKELTLQGKTPPEAEDAVLGITKSSLNTSSFIAAASFQETTRILTEASIRGKVDYLRGLKENVVIGRLIPAGTGFDLYEKYDYIKVSDK
ncbi:DNA-directed RNA polymerase subunit beta' [Thermodesulfobium sp.]